MQTKILVDQSLPRSKNRPCKDSGDPCQNETPRKDKESDARKEAIHSDKVRMRRSPRYKVSNSPAKGAHV